MGGKPSKGTKKDRRLTANKPKQQPKTLFTRSKGKK